MRRPAMMLRISRFIDEWSKRSLKKTEVSKYAGGRARGDLLPLLLRFVVGYTFLSYLIESYRLVFR